MIAPLSRTVAPFSTEVRLSVELDGEVHSLSAVGSEAFVLTEPRQLRAGPATLIIEIDGEPRRRAIVVVESTVDARRFAYMPS